jgi:hypothetical protein
MDCVRTLVAGDCKSVRSLREDLSGIELLGEAEDRLPRRILSSKTAAKNGPITGW